MKKGILKIEIKFPVSSIEFQMGTLALASAFSEAVFLKNKEVFYA